MRHRDRFALGAIGGLLPILVSLLAADIANVVDHRDVLSAGIYVGYLIRVIILLLLGGTIAAVNTQIDNPLALLQLGIAAPALITAYINATPIQARSSNAPNTVGNLLIPSAFAEPVHAEKTITLAGWFDDVLSGLTRSSGDIVTLGQAGRQRDRERAEEAAARQKAEELAALKNAVGIICSNPERADRILAIEGDATKTLTLRIQGVEVSPVITNDQWETIKGVIFDNKGMSENCTSYLFQTLLPIVVPPSPASK